MLAAKVITGEYPVWFSVGKGDLGKDLHSGAPRAIKIVGPAMQKIMRAKICSDL